MDDLTDKLQSLLSDPESMRDLAELAAMLRGDAGESAGESAAPEPPPDTAGAAEMPDLTKLLAVGQALSGMQQDENTALLLALKPHLSAERQAKVGRAVRMLKLWNAASVLRENGMLSELLGGP
ncbi:MAG: hypothetical protein K6E36_01285 [Oscillospiraceae bacterium]|nr:hypothetical protein [Oscillospiraceae bacterium]